MARLYPKILAWSVHVFTSMGLLAAFMAMIAIDNKNWSIGFIWLIVCFIIDSLDGTLARKFKVDEILPSMDGKSIDYVIDFTTYALIPTFFFYKAEMSQGTLLNISVVIMLLSAALYYGKKDMVEDNEYFIGFPVLWNFVVFFQFFIFQNNQTLNFISVIFFGILHFLPVRFAYPSKSKRFFIPHLIFSIIGISGAIAVLYQYPERSFITETSAIIGGLYFGLMAIYDTINRKKLIGDF